MKKEKRALLMKKKTMSKMPMLMKLWPMMRVSLSTMTKMPKASPAVKAKKKARLVKNRKVMRRKTLLVMKFTPKPKMTLSPSKKRRKTRRKMSLVMISTPKLKIRANLAMTRIETRMKILMMIKSL